MTGAHIAAIGAQHAIGAIDVRVIFRAALAACSSAIIVGHNHPSGDPNPSPEDLAATSGIMRAANVLAMPLVDHVIVTSRAGRYYSMLEQGTLPQLDT